MRFWCIPHDIRSGDFKWLFSCGGSNSTLVHDLWSCFSSSQLVAGRLGATLISAYLCLNCLGGGSPMVKRSMKPSLYGWGEWISEVNRLARELEVQPRPRTWVLRPWVSILVLLSSACSVKRRSWRRLSFHFPAKGQRRLGTFSYH